MTITLPFPDPLADDFDPLPGNNTSAPPVGAPEGQATSTMNDCVRQCMAAINQIWQNQEAINNALGSMSEQNANNVNITGGTISAATTVAQATNALQFGGLTPQQRYDAEFPIGTVIDKGDSETAPVPPAGVVATWALFGPGNYPKYIQSGQTVGQIFGSSNTDPAGAHDHGGQTGSIALQIGQIPPHTHDVTAVGSGGSGTAAGTGINTAATTLTTESTGAGGVHEHPINSQGDHTHVIAPPSIRIAGYIRTA